MVAGYRLSCFPLERRLLYQCQKHLVRLHRLLQAGSSEVLARKSASMPTEADLAATRERQTGLQERRKAKFEAWISHELDQAEGEMVE